MPADASWCIRFTFSPIGDVKDDEKVDLDSYKLLKLLSEKTEKSNSKREKLGLKKLKIKDRAVTPRYNSRSHNLEWAMTYIDDEGFETTNHEVRLTRSESCH